MTALTAATAWEQAPAAPGWEGPPVWVHSDLMPGNLLVADGRLVGLRPQPPTPGGEAPGQRGGSGGGGLFPSPPLPETGAPPRPRSSSAGGAGLRVLPWGLVP
ncbi:phosphotransferase [Streptomyces antimycoticus]|uniref:phosphotransferase n=1 Tax=Streptomyces antimycoticus TaxID=68175 RepID=UPI00369620B6